VRAVMATVYPAPAAGSVPAIASKSQAHRLLIAAALADAPTRVACADVSEDIEATARCLNALCADITYSGGAYAVSPRAASTGAVLDCGESGSTWRFLLPVAAALGARATFLLRGRLPQRPMDTLYRALEAQGVVITGKGSERVTVEGRLMGGMTDIAGDVSSQFISGLLLAAPLTGQDCDIRLTTKLGSAAYVDITLQALARFGIRAEKLPGALHVPGGQHYRSPGSVAAEGDWSNAAFWLCLGAVAGGPITCTGLDTESPQGDRAVLDMLRAFGARVSVSGDAVTVSGGGLHAAQIDIDATPDLAPALALLGLAAKGETRLTRIARLRLKESDRAQTITDALRAMGAQAEIGGDCLIIRGGKSLPGGTCDAAGDHRIAMMAACAASLCEGPVIIRGARAVDKSYPRFFDDLRALGPRVEEE